MEDEEIKNVIFSIKALKAVVIDGPHALFYQTQWHVWENMFEVLSNAFLMALRS